ncbi:transcription termination/antitermination protein NusG [Pontibacter beigongshangensis]|uniref:transcription termination/antitermination protein NusG n=1 Tax=Pontibacter beigongshangensis TaxID=2574733 RepID=UPI00164F5D13|nr:UpxY family transcription antiterminator [Pontibacter beigongshangensis]
MSQRWYAVYTKPRWEKKVAKTLSVRDIENYCPLNKVEHQWSDRKKVVYLPLFTSYVFIRITDKQLSLLKSIDGIISIVTWLGKPAIIKDEEIIAIKQFLKNHSNVQVEKNNVAINDKIKITNGSLVDQEGTIVALKNNLIVVSLPSLGYVMYVEVARESVEKVTSAPT